MIRTLEPADAERLWAIRVESLKAEPLAFLSSPGSDHAKGPDDLREGLAEGKNPVFGAFVGDEIVGMAGLFRDHHAKTAHKIHLFGMYVRSEHRGQGYATQLLDFAIAHARTIDGVEQMHLGVTTAATEAHRIYERAGFRSYGLEPDAMRHDGVSVDQHHMVLKL